MNSIRGVFMCVIIATLITNCGNQNNVLKYSGKNTFAGKNAENYSAYKYTVEVDIYEDTLILIENGWTGEVNYHGVISYFSLTEQRGDTALYKFCENLRGVTKYESISWYKATKDFIGLNCYFENGHQLETFGVFKISRKKLSGTLKERYLRY